MRILTWVCNQLTSSRRVPGILVDLAVQFLAGSNPAIVPSRDHALPEEPGEVFLELVAQGLVGVRVVRTAEQ